MTLLQVYRIHDGDGEWLVRGTDDPAEALAALIEDADASDEMKAYIEDNEEDVEPRLDVSYKGYCRMNPCNTGEYGWMLGYANGPGRGNFKAVYGDLRWDEIEFESDEALD